MAFLKKIVVYPCDSIGNTFYVDFVKKNTKLFIRTLSSGGMIMDNLKMFAYDNYYSATGLDKYWYAFENVLELKFPSSSEQEKFRKRVGRLEKYLTQLCIHETFWSQIYCTESTRKLAELQPLIFREQSGDKSAHKAFASDFLRFKNNQNPKEPITRVLNLIYTVRCNVHHGEKPLPAEFKAVRERNELILSLTTPIIAKIDELLITLFVTEGIFSFCTFQETERDQHVPFPIEHVDGFKIKGNLFNLGKFPAWCYNTFGWVHGCLLWVPENYRIEQLASCDRIVGNQFEHRLTLAYDEFDQPQHVVWAYQYLEEPPWNSHINDGIWKDSSKKG